jgi:hypothetical protein
VGLRRYCFETFSPQNHVSTSLKQYSLPRNKDNIQGRTEPIKLTKSYLENLKGRFHSEDLDIDGNVVLKYR